MKLSNEFLVLLTCPVFGDLLEYNAKNNILLNKNANLIYPIIEGIPLLLASEAQKV